MVKSSGIHKDVHTAGNKKTVVVGLSGGVDSSVAAKTLLDEGYSVIGLFLSGWHPPDAQCSSPYDRQDAMRVCAHLGIPFEEIDAHQCFNDSVIEPFFYAYERGETPNPDVLCNSEVKFVLLASAADTLGAEYIATGHYTQKTDDGILKRSIDESKDQTYFLWNVSPDVLKRTLFPIGSHTKKTVRAIAKKHNLPTADKKDSVGLCFVGDISVSSMLETRFDVAQGDVYLSTGEKIGTHRGALLYTEGQRHGFTLLSPYNAIPHFVIEKNVKDNTLVVSPNKEDFLTQAYHISHTHFVIQPKLPLYAQLRHLATLVPVSHIQAMPDTEQMEVHMSQPVLAPKGQSAVFFSQDGICVGGGIIE